MYMFVFLRKKMLSLFSGKHNNKAIKHILCIYDYDCCDLEVVNHCVLHVVKIIFTKKQYIEFTFEKQMIFWGVHGHEY